MFLATPDDQADKARLKPPETYTVCASIGVRRVRIVRMRTIARAKTTKRRQTHKRYRRENRTLRLKIRVFRPYHPTT